MVRAGYGWIKTTHGTGPISTVLFELGLTNLPNCGTESYLFVTFVTLNIEV